MPINAKLVVVGGEVKTAEIKLRLPCTIGRGRGCTIMLPQALVSRQHCELFETGGQVMVRDLGSLNGTFVNNQKIADPSPIRSEELLTIGTVTFRVVYEGASAASTPTGTGPEIKSPADDDSAHPLEIGDFDFETESPGPGEHAKTPFGPLMPDVRIGAQSAGTPAVPSAPKPAAIPVAKPIAPAAKPTIPAVKPGAPAPIPTTPAASASAPPTVPAAEEKEEKEEEDDFQDFLKSLGK